MKFVIRQAIVVCGLSIFSLSAADLPRCDFAPGFTQSGPARTYAADTLYDYMNGNSEGYLIYGFKQMRGVTCKSGDVTFVIDISEMNDPEAAWGLYASNRDQRMATEKLGISGQDVPQPGKIQKGAR